jgi:hypothetical protein
MKKFARLISAALLAVSFVAVQVTTAATAGAATTTGAGNGLKISPVRTDLTIQPGASQTITVTIQNVTKATATFQAIVNDFVAGDNENGQPSLILDANQYAPSHSLKRYIAPIPDVTVPAGESKEVKVTISVPKDAAGGGYFGAVRFAPASSDGSDNKNVTLSASVGSLILVKVPGNIVDNMTIKSFDVRGSTDSETASSFYTSNKSLYAVVRFQNKGNVQEQPFGKVVLKKGSKVLQTTEINNTDPRGNVLPDSIRRFSVQLKKVGSWGKYTVEGNFGYGSNGQLLSASTTFYVVPVALIIAVIVLILIILLLIFWLPKAVKRYNQRVLKRAGRR